MCLSYPLQLRDVQRDHDFSVTTHQKGITTGADFHIFSKTWKEVAASL